MFPPKTRIMKNIAVCFKTHTERWKRMAKSINSPDYENGGLLAPAFFAGPENTHDGSIVVFAYINAANNSEAWAQVQNRLPVVAVLWTTDIPKEVSIEGFGDCLSVYTDPDVIPTIDFDNIKPVE